MLYPIGWLAPALPQPAAHPLSAGPSSTLPSTPETAPQHWQGAINGLAWATHGPRWAPGPHHRSQPLVAHVSASWSGQPAAFATPSQFNQALMLHQGRQGDAVRVLQARLQQLGYDPGPLDGYFGPQTERAVRQFQQASHIAVDGVVGVITWRYLAPGQALTATVDSPPAAPPTLATNGMTSVLPSATEALSTHVSLHPMAVLPEVPRAKAVGIVVLSLGLAGLVGHLGFRPDAILRPRRSSASASPYPIHTPRPIYPATPSPAYPAGASSSNSVPAAATLPDPRPSVVDLSGSGPSVPNPSVPNSSTPNLSTPNLSTPNLSTPNLSTPNLSMPNPSTLNPSAPSAPSAPAHLPNFVYDLLQPYGRYQLEVLLTGTAAEERPQNPPMLAALLQRVGFFPERNYRTGSAYTYLLLDDVGGGFRLCGNELWLTHLAHQWFQPDVAYTALIRRIDAAGQVLDKEFTVALSRQQLDWVA